MGANSPMGCAVVVVIVVVLVVVVVLGQWHCFVLKGGCNTPAAFFVCLYTIAHTTTTKAPMQGITEDGQCFPRHIPGCQMSSSSLLLPSAQRVFLILSRAANIS